VHVIVGVNGIGRLLDNILNTSRHLNLERQFRLLHQLRRNISRQTEKRGICSAKVQMTFRFVCEGAILRRFEEGSAFTSCSSAVIDGGVDGFARVLLRVTGDLDGAERLVEGSVASDLKEVLDRTGLCWTPVFREDGLSGVDVDGLSGEDVDGISGVWKLSTEILVKMLRKTELKKSHLSTVKDL